MKKLITIAIAGALLSFLGSAGLANSNGHGQKGKVAITDISTAFDAEYYATNPDLAKADLNTGQLFDHIINFESREGRHSVGAFDVSDTLISYETRDRLEIAFNNRDDNSNRKVDETEYSYRSEGWNNGKHSFSIVVKINSNRVVSAFNSGQLYAKVFYQKLTDTSYEMETNYIRVSSIEDYTVQRYPAKYTILRLSGLEETSVYRARVQFYKGREIVQEAGNIYYYSTTTDPDSKVSRARTKILLEAFKQYYDQQQGLVGRNGSVHVNGTRYGADINESWCSEFYAWVSSTALKNISGRASTNQLANYFGSRYYTNRRQMFARIKRANWLGLDTSGDGKMNHSAMILAYDHHLGKIWTIEGNTGGKVEIKIRSLDQVYGLGDIGSGFVRRGI